MTEDSYLKVILFSCFQRKKMGVDLMVCDKCGACFDDTHFHDICPECGHKNCDDECGSDCYCRCEKPLPGEFIRSKLYEHFGTSSPTISMRTGLFYQEIFWARMRRWCKSPDNKKLILKLRPMFHL